MAVRAIATDPLRNYKFHVVIPKMVRGTTVSLTRLGFMAVSGLAATTEPISYREGGDNTTPRKMPGQTDFPPVSLTRGVVGGTTDRGMLWQWYQEIFAMTQGSLGWGTLQDFRSEIYIRVFNSPDTRPYQYADRQGPGHVPAAWKLYNAWPTSMAFSDLDAGGNGALITNMTLMYEGFDFRTFVTGDNAGSGAW